MTIIELEHVRKRFARRTVLSDVSLTIEEASTVALVGPNGSGKSVLLRLICGFLAPDAGRVMIDARFMSRGRTFPERFGVCIDGPAYLGGLSAERNLQALVDIRGVAGRADVREALDRVGLEPGRTKARHFSLGMKQKLSLAQALVEHPEVLVLDEPFDALDQASVERVKLILREEQEKGTTIVFTSHRAVDISDLADRVLHLDDGVVDEVPLPDVTG